MTKSDLRNLCVIWLAGILLSLAAAAFVYRMYDPANPAPAPVGMESPTTSWINAPATTIASAVQRNTVWTIVVICPFLFAPIGTLLYIIVRFSKKNNPVADQTHENLPLEVFWTVTPALVLVAMAIPAYAVLRKIDIQPSKADVQVTVKGAQFFWNYTFEKYGVSVTDDGTGTEPVYFPVNKMIRLNGMSEQVNHAWWVPAFGIKFDVIPGRITGGWIKPTKEGFFKGQCAELCGALHAYMWIHVKIVPEREFYQWLESKKAKWPADEEVRIKAILAGAPAQVINQLALAQ